MEVSCEVILIRKKKGILLFKNVILNLKIIRKQERYDIFLQCNTKALSNRPTLESQSHLPALDFAI